MKNTYGISNKEDYINVLLKPYIDKFSISIENKVHEYNPIYLTAPSISIKFFHYEGLNYIRIILKDILLEKLKFDCLQEYIRSLSDMDIIYTHFVTCDDFDFDSIFNRIDITNKNLDKLYHKIGGMK